MIKNIKISCFFTYSIILIEISAPIKVLLVAENHLVRIKLLLFFSLAKKTYEQIVNFGLSFICTRVKFVKIIFPVTKSCQSNIRRLPLYCTVQDSEALFKTTFKHLKPKLIFTRMQKGKTMQGQTFRSRSGRRL
jgi:hypothetical protein